ncbi:acyl-CoA thioester hydrolase/BAAT C-terminal domain-containing protein [Occultella kanbiaonis]|uniref:acyl-CoA thioester hydrolase/BAAT C-terminal domain-containing protein n=1 Tax=Occultella kanbiaonis TaxID=2675754 RepID=UPI0013D4F17A|nr:acyl-CoA thioester hydrolase/BAAT C-terminal domain-containing protein [Occultella kanbiaonis]
MEVYETPIRRHGLVGLLCTPRTAAPAPGVLLVGGSEGGRHDRDAVVLAGEGFAVFALSYFADRGLARGLVDIPLELFSRGLDLLESVSEGRTLGVTGGSRGGEAALLVAAHDHRVGAVASIAGSGVVTQGIDYGAGLLPQILRREVASWTLGGERLPYLPYANLDEIDRLVAATEPVPLGVAFPPVPTDPDVLYRVSIPVERISGKVLSICGDEDRMWPSDTYTRVAVDRLAAHDRAGDIEHVVLPGVGHPIAGPPGQPFTSTLSPGPGVTFEMGGSPRANTAGRVEAWRRQVMFFKRELDADQR